jgi:hypothetical protein
LNKLYPALGKYVPHQPSLPQAIFLLLDEREAFYGGAAGGGKSDALLMAALRHVDTPGYSALILRRTFPELQGAGGLLHRSKQWLSNTDAEWNEQQKVWKFPSGATLQFGHVANSVDMFKYDGQEYQFVGFDELTHFTEEIYDHIGFTRARRDMTIADAGIPIRTRTTAMPEGIGYGWVKRRFITHRRSGVPFVPAKAWDNPGLDVEEYATNSLGHLPEAKRKRLLDGDWDIYVGAALPDFDQNIHCVTQFPLTPDLERIECVDYGLNGTAWYLLVSDYDGNLIFVDGVEDKDKLASDLVPLLERKYGGGWGRKNRRVADSTLWRRSGTINRWGQPASVPTEFSNLGVALQPANNDPRAGLLRLLELVKVDPAHRFPDWHPLRGQEGAPRFYVNSVRCPQLVEQLMSAPLQPEDKPNAGEIIDPDWESRYGHSVAAARYGVMAWPEPSRPPANSQYREEIVDPAQQRALALEEYERRIEAGYTKRSRYQRV